MYAKPRKHLGREDLLAASPHEERREVRGHSFAWHPERQRAAPGAAAVPQSQVSGRASPAPRYTATPPPPPPASRAPQARSAALSSVQSWYAPSPSHSVEDGAAAAGAQRRGDAGGGRRREVLLGLLPGRGQDAHGDGRAALEGRPMWSWGSAATTGPRHTNECVYRL
ncbi:hypothetical protein DL770_004057 [Monosporascus sp. CRB-9-2]|nr:hypothetical protein DL770_004057 [Monosporascus sp. CRB-9-2]